MTHNIEEAVLMADRIVVMGKDPGHVMTEMRVGLRHPRHRKDTAFQAVVDKVYAAVTGKTTLAAAGAPGQLTNSIWSRPPETGALGVASPASVCAGLFTPCSIALPKRASSRSPAPPRVPDFWVVLGGGVALGLRLTPHPGAVPMV